MPPEQRTRILYNLDRTLTAIQKHLASITKQNQVNESAERPALQLDVRIPEVSEYYRSEQVERPKKDLRERLRMFLEIAGAIIALSISGLTLATLIVVHGQLNEMRRTTAEMHNAAVLDQRAWIGMEDRKITNLAANTPLRTDVTFSNTGKTPALDVSSASSYLFSKTQIFGPALNLLDDATAEPLAAVAPNGTFTLFYRLPLEELSPHFSAMKNGDEWFYMFGEITYTDVTRTIQGSTKWCVYLDWTNFTEPRLMFCRSFGDLR